MCGRKSACSVTLKSRLIPFPAFTCLTALEAAALLGLLWGAGARTGLPPRRTNAPCHFGTFCTAPQCHLKSQGEPDIVFVLYCKWLSGVRCCMQLKNSF